MHTLYFDRLCGRLGPVKLPVMPPVPPMLAKPIGDIPAGQMYEPKWDGFRSIVFRDGDDVEIGSRNERPMTRYFPEVVAAIKANFPERAVVDGEVVVADTARNTLDFDALQQRIHPAVSRVNLLAEQTPASFIAFDLLALGDDDLTGRPFAERRALLEEAFADAAPPIHLTPVTRDLDVARQWFEQFEGAGLDGLIAKKLDLPYQPDKRVMSKIKHERTADCVVAGYRVHKSGPDALGSLLLGLYDDRGVLNSIGVVGAFPMATADRCSPSCSRSSPRSTSTRGTGRRTSRASAPRARTRPAAGTRARTCRSCRCGPNAWSRFATTTWRATGSATPRSSCAGGRTASRSRARTSSWSGRSSSTWPTC